MFMADWQPFGHYHVDWGNVAAWLAALLTGGSLLLGFFIILRDRRREVRRQANQISCFLSGESREELDANEDVVKGEYRTTLYLHNASDGMVMIPHLRGRPAKHRKDLRQVGSGLPERPVPNAKTPHDWVWRLHPNEDVVIQVETDAQRDEYSWSLDFFDTANRHWERDLKTHKLRKAKEPPGRSRTKLKYWWLKYVKRRKFWKPPVEQ
jgi:hypothetical protein